MSDEYTIKEVIEARFQEISNHLMEIKSDGKETKQKVEFQNGRVRKLEDWSVEAGGIIKDISKTVDNYKTDKAKLWTGFFLLTILGGTIITLSVMAIDNKIEKGIRTALANYNIEVTK